MKRNLFRWTLICCLVWSAACSDSKTNNNSTKDMSPDQGDMASDQNADAGDMMTVCKPNGARCRDLGTRLVCNAQGSAEVTEPCPGTTLCQEETGQCLDKVCEPGQFAACTEQGQQRYCNTSGTGYIESPCPGNAPCEDGKCANAECIANTKRCLDPQHIQLCNGAGAWVPGELCPTGTECFSGECVPLCELNKKVSSYIGCEYWSVDLDNYDDALSQPHAIVITNPNDTLSARVQIFEGYSNKTIEVGADGQPFDLVIPPKEVRIYSIPVGYDHSGTRQLRDKALRVTSSIPVIAHQFNPLNNVDVYSNDGTLLIPTNAIGTEYWGLSWPHRGGRVRIRGFLTIVNSTGAPNKVTVRPRAQVISGPDIPAIEPNTERVFNLGPGESLNLETSGIEFDDALEKGCLQTTEGPPPNIYPCPDLTGTHIKADLPITVFGGHQCGNVVLGIDRCDHMETVLFPVDSWGKDYVGTKFFPRATSQVTEPDIWRVIAAEDGTQILTDPPIVGIHGTTLAAGEWRQFEARESFRLGSSKPVSLSQYMVGSNWLGIPRICNKGIDAANPTGIGDPAMALAVPTSQFRKDYFVLTPKAYSDDYLNIIAPKGATILLDDQPIDASKFKLIGERKDYQYAQLVIEDGFHKLTSTVPFGVVSYGYDCHVSYASAGGLNLESSTP